MLVDNAIGTLASFASPRSVAVDTFGNVFVADSNANRIRVIFATNSGLAACDSTWHHLALTHGDGSVSSTKTYVDGALVLTSSQSLALPSDGSGVLTVGWTGLETAGVGQLFAGSLAEIRIYGRALSSFEALQLSQPSLSAISNAVTVPGVPSPSSSSYTYSCVAGSAGYHGVLQKSTVDNGWSWVSGSAPTCTTCAAGTAAQPGSVACAPCYPGTYSLAGAAACTLCPAGTYGDRAGLTSAACSGACATCPAGSSRPASTS